MRRKVSILFFELEGWWRRIRRAAHRPGKAVGSDEAYALAVGTATLLERAVGSDAALHRAVGSAEPL